MKKLISLVFVLALFVQFAHAQQRGQGQRMTSEQRTKMMVERLGLDDAQQKKLVEINKTFDAKTGDLRQRIRDAEDDERMDLIASMRAIQTERSNEIKKILKPEQKEKYDEMIKKMTEMRKKNQGKRKTNQRNGAVRPGK